MQTSFTPVPPSDQYWQDRQWIHDHYPQLVGQYANEWVAVQQGRVLAFGPDLGSVEDVARNQCQAADIVFQFIDDGSLIL